MKIQYIKVQDTAKPVIRNKIITLNPLLKNYQFSQLPTKESRKNQQNQASDEQQMGNNKGQRRNQSNSQQMNNKGKQHEKLNLSKIK